MNEYLRFFKYTLLSASAGLLEFGSFALFNEVFHWHYWVSYLIALVLSVIWNFTINRKLTFKSTNNVPVAMLKVFGYYCVFTPVSTWLEQYLAGNLWWNEYWVTIINLVFNLATEYTFQRLVVYGKNVDQR
ncbi:MAG: GtrA family protein [Bacteroidales bacterium]|nr:GtrA family protein [Bacteroidales bacterium]